LGIDRIPKDIVEAALRNNCKSIAYTYNEPIIFIEFIYDCAKLAKSKGLKNVLVTNGYFSKESFDYLNKEKLIDAMNIDLKSFYNKTYEKYCGCKLKPILDLIKRSFKSGIHIEITTLIIPGINDSEKELKKIASFIASVSKDIQWHISRFFPNVRNLLISEHSENHNSIQDFLSYKMQDKSITPIATLEKAREIGVKAGLKYVYIGNVDN
jgi:pyruvate formate lyase activating enzyme